MSSPCLKSVFSVTTEIEGPSTNTSWLVFFKSIRYTPNPNSYGLRITGLSGILMYSPISSQVISILEPRDEVEFSWDQMKNDGDLAHEGLYKISAKGMDSQGNKIEKSTTVTIWK